MTVENPLAVWGMTLEDHAQYVLRLGAQGSQDLRQTNAANTVLAVKAQLEVAGQQDVGTKSLVAATDRLVKVTGRLVLATLVLAAASIIGAFLIAVLH